LDDVALPVPKQLEAYNVRGIDAFRLWSARDYLKARHVERFKEPDFYNNLLIRIVVGNEVIDHEAVPQPPQGKGEIDVVCIYEIEVNKIAKGWLKRASPECIRSSPDVCRQ
jgi:putative hydrolase of HD superfamily